MPYATENHQEYNAKVLVNVGAAKIILDKDLNLKSLSTEIQGIICNTDTIIQMEENARKIENKNVEEKIYQEIKKM